MISLREAIATAESLLPGRAAPEGQLDQRWQAIIEIGEFVRSDAEDVWIFAARWGCSSDPDVRAAVATCLLEHLLEHHFDLLFPRVEALARSNANFAATVRACWVFAGTLTSANAARLQELKARL